MFTSPLYGPPGSAQAVAPGTVGAAFASAAPAPGGFAGTAGAGGMAGGLAGANPASAGIQAGAQAVTGIASAALAEPSMTTNQGDITFGAFQFAGSGSRQAQGLTGGMIGWILGGIAAVLLVLVLALRKG